MPSRFQTPRGTQDVLPADQPYWDAVLSVSRAVALRYGFRRIDTPVFEDASLFEKGSGDTSDVVEKEMYAFEDRGGERLALTPEATPAIARAYLEHGMGSWPQPVRLFTTHQMFRYDRPQKGRYRQHTQFDCEVLGSADALADAEVISLLWDVYRELGITGLRVHLGSIDDLEPRRAYVEELKDYFRPFLPRMSDDARRRFDRNPLRLLDSKDDRDQPFKADAPKLVDRLSPAAGAHMQLVREALEAAAIPYDIDPLLVRGLDYYNRTVFEVVPVDDDRAQGTVGAGGRYDGLMELLGGPPTPGVGFGCGIERVIIEMQRCGITFEATPLADVFVVHRAEGSHRVAFKLAADLRALGLSVVVGETGRSFKAQMRSANSIGATMVAIIGDDELAAGSVALKNLAHEGDQWTVALADAPREVLAQLRPQVRLETTRPNRS